MSKRNKNKNKKHTNNHYKRANTASIEPRGDEKSSISLDDHLEQMELQSIGASSSDDTSTTIAKTDDVTPTEIKEDEKNQETVTVASTEVVGEKKSNKAGKAFVWGLLLGALIISILF